MIGRGASAARAVAADERARYVAINLAVSLFVLLRSYISMLVLDYRGLGLVTIVQSIVLLLGIAQFGFLNGGYRLLCSADEAEARRINALIYGVMAAIGGAAILAGLAYALAASEADALWVVGLGVVGGVATLIRTWMSNQMIAAARFAELNRVNLWSGLASLLVLVAIPLAPLPVCLAAIVVQPLGFVLLVVWRDPATRPAGVAFDAALARRVLAAGFLVFLSTMLLQANIQIERWYVAAALGLDGLGHLFLAILFTTLFQLVPTSLDAIYLPRLVRAHESGEPGAVGRGIAEYLLLLAGYGVAALLAVALLARPLTALLLPSYVEDLRYVMLIAPGLALITIASGFSVTFSILIRYRWLGIAYGAGTAALAALFGGAILAGVRLTLDQVTIARSAVFALTALLLLTGYLLTAHARPEFRPRWPWTRRAPMP